MKMFRAFIGKCSWFNRIHQSVTINQQEGSFMPIGQWIDIYKNGAGDYIVSPKILEKQNLLKNAGVLTIKMVALSGIGKTRLLYETFKDKTCISDKSFICLKSDSKDLEQSVITFFIKDGNDADLLILDDCPNDVFVRIIAHRDQYNPHCKLIGINNDYFNHLNHVSCNLLKLEVDDVRKEVYEYIDAEIPAENGDVFYREQVKKISDGYPFLAIQLVEAFKNCKHVNALDVEALMPGLLKIDPAKENNELIVMQTLALFQPLGFSGSRSPDFELVVTTPLITPLFGLSNDEKRILFNKVIRKFQDTFIDKGTEYLNVRPLPLAIWLVKKWLETNDIVKVANLLKQQSSSIATTLISSMSRRLEEMRGNTLAEAMVDELAKDSSSDFCKEEVVCSDLGSRLFLALTVVNPVVICRIISRVINKLSCEELRENLKDNARRNVVMILEKLCYIRETARDAILMIAKLSVAENEKWSNNATGQFGQLFHIFLPGTVLPLKERTEVLGELINFGDNYRDVVLTAINHSFTNNHFSRSGGPECFGSEKIIDYVPSDSAIYDYWSSVSSILINWCEEVPDVIEGASQIIQNHINSFIANGNIICVKTLIEKLIAIQNNRWNNLYEELLRIRNIHDDLSDSVRNILDGWINRLRPEEFSFRLKEARTEMYRSYKLSEKDREEKLRKVYTPIVDSLISTSVYASEQEIRNLMNDLEFADFYFTHLLRLKMSAENSTKMFSTIQRILLNEQGGVNNRFVNSLCNAYRGTESLYSFTEWLLHHEKSIMFCVIMGVSEDANTSNLSRIEAKISEGVLTRDDLLVYLNHVNIWSDEQFENLIEHLEKGYPEFLNAICHFLIDHRFMLGRDESKRLVDASYRMALRYELSSENNRDNYEFTRFLSELLKSHRNPQAAKELNIKYISVLNTGHFHGNLDNIFEVLLRLYPNETWNYFAEKLISEDYELFYLQVHHDVGSGSSFGRGPLFDDDDRVIDFCKAHSDKAPQVFAGMIPLYSDKKKNSFGRLFMYMLDEFGDDESVLSGLHANMHSFSWVGSTIPLFEDNIECLKVLLSHKRTSVSVWAQRCIKEYEEEIRRETSQEEFMRMHYDR